MQHQLPRSWSYDMVTGPDEVLVVRFNGPAPAHIPLEPTRDALASLIAATLPGYGDGLTPARCLHTNTHSVLWLTTDRALAGFAALNLLDVRGEPCLYITLTAIAPSLQGGHLLSVELSRVIHETHPTLLAATTNVPAIYRVIEKASAASFVDQQPRIAPPRAMSRARPFADQLTELAADILRVAVPGAVTAVDGHLVRRAYRSRDLQAEPAAEYLATQLDHAQRHGLDTDTVELFHDRLSLGIGDAVLVVAALGSPDAGGVTWSQV